MCFGSPSPQMPDPAAERRQAEADATSAANSERQEISRRRRGQSLLATGMTREAQQTATTVLGGYAAGKTALGG